METNITKETTKKRKIFAVFKILEIGNSRKDSEHDHYICVPKSWIEHYLSRSWKQGVLYRTVYVACPYYEDMSEFKKLAKRRTKVKNNWSLHYAAIEYETNTFQDGEDWIARNKICRANPEKDSRNRGALPKPAVDRSSDNSVSTCVSNLKKRKRYIYTYPRKPLPRMRIIVRPDITEKESNIIANSTETNVESGSSNIELPMVTDNPQLSCTSETEKKVVVANVEKGMQLQCMTENKSIAEPVSSNTQDSRKNTPSSFEIPDPSQPVSTVHSNDSLQMPIEHYKETRSCCQKTVTNGGGIIIINDQVINSPQTETTALAPRVEKNIRPHCITESKSIAKQDTSATLLAANKSAPVRQQICEKETSTVIKVDRSTMNQKLQPKTIPKKTSYLGEAPSTSLSKMPTQTASALRYDSLQMLYMQEISTQQNKDTNNYVQKSDVNDVMIPTTAALSKPSTSADEHSQVYQHSSFHNSQRSASSHVPQKILSVTSTKRTPGGKRPWPDNIAKSIPSTSQDFLNTKKSRSQQYNNNSEKPCSSVIKNPVNEKLHNRIINPSYITTTSNATNQSNYLPRYSVHGPACEIPENYLRETPRVLQMQSGYYFGGLCINPDSLQRKPESTYVNQFDYITTHQLNNNNNISAAQNLLNLAQQARSFNQQPGGQRIEVNSNKNGSIGQGYDIHDPNIKTFAFQNEIDRTKQSIDFPSYTQDSSCVFRHPQNMRSNLDIVLDLSNHHQEPQQDSRMSSMHFKSSIGQGLVPNHLNTNNISAGQNFSNLAQQACSFNQHTYYDAHTRMQESLSEEYVNQKNMDSSEPTLVTPNFEVPTTCSTCQLNKEHHFIKKQSIPDHVHLNPRTKKIMVDVSTETNFNREYHEVGVQISPKVKDKMCQTGFEEDSLSLHHENIPDHETNANLDAPLGYQKLAKGAPVKKINDDSHNEESIPTVSDSVSGPRVGQDSDITSNMRLRNAMEQELLDSIGVLFSKMSNNVTKASELFMFSRNSMIALSKTYKKLLESVDRYNAAVLHPN